MKRWIFYSIATLTLGIGVTATSVEREAPLEKATFVATEGLEILAPAQPDWRVQLQLSFERGNGRPNSKIYAAASVFPGPGATGQSQHATLQMLVPADFTSPLIAQLPYESDNQQPPFGILDGMVVHEEFKRLPDGRFSGEAVALRRNLFGKNVERSTVTIIFELSEKLDELLRFEIRNESQKAASGGWGQKQTTLEVKSFNSTSWKLSR